MPKTTPAEAGIKDFFTALALDLNGSPNAYQLIDEEGHAAVMFPGITSKQSLALQKFISPFLGMTDSDIASVVASFKISLDDLARQTPESGTGKASVTIDLPEIADGKVTHLHPPTNFGTGRMTWDGNNLCYAAPWENMRRLLLDRKFVALVNELGVVLMPNKTQSVSLDDLSTMFGGLDKPRKKRKTPKVKRPRKPGAGKKKKLELVSNEP